MLRYINRCHARCKPSRPPPPPPPPHLPDPLLSPDLATSKQCQSCQRYITLAIIPPPWVSSCLFLCLCVVAAWTTTKKNEAERAARLRQRGRAHGAPPCPAGVRLGSDVAPYGGEEQRPSTRRPPGVAGILRGCLLAAGKGGQGLHRRWNSSATTTLSRGGTHGELWVEFFSFCVFFACPGGKRAMYSSKTLSRTLGGPVNSFNTNGFHAETDVVD